MGRTTMDGAVAVIMAGGIGERFWPVSRPDRPKQLLPLGPEKRTLLEDTILRLQAVIGRDRLLVVTGEPLRPALLDARLPIPDARIIAEPHKRNTLGAVAWATAWAVARMGAGPETVLAVVPADQHVGDEAAFQRDLRIAIAAATQMDAVVTIGIEPTRPETGYGYIEREDTSLELEGADTDGRLHPVVRFREKPDPQTALRFYQSGRFLWNGGMFFWGIETLLSELERANPQVADTIERIAAALKAGDDATAAELFATLPNTSIDYALMEHASHVMVVRASFPWDDLGSWDAWRRVSETDALGNATLGDPLVVDCRDCAVYADIEELPVAVIGMDGAVIAVSDAGVLVAPIERAQDVRDVVRQLREEERSSGSDG